ncbi:hypothetical protein JHK87_055853 [Glycine soja]|nr:hypothetical protein JHK87_055853 [Glycine soja]
MSGMVGTTYYMTLEVLLEREYDEKVDVWSYGVILYIMLAMIPPFYGDSAAEIFEVVLRDKLRFPSRIFRTASLVAKDLLRKMICRYSSRRFSTEQALSTWCIPAQGTYGPSIQAIHAIPEVDSLAKLKASRMEELVLNKRSELEEICKLTHIEPYTSIAASALIDSGMFLCINRLFTYNYLLECFLEQLSSKKYFCFSKLS